MPPRAALNFVFVLLRPSGDGVTQEDLDKYEADLYAPLDGDRPLLTLMDQIGG